MSLVKLFLKCQQCVLIIVMWQWVTQAVGSEVRLPAKYSNSNNVAFTVGVGKGESNRLHHPPQSSQHLYYNCNWSLLFPSVELNKWCLKLGCHLSGERYSVFKELDWGLHFEFSFEKLMASFCGTDFSSSRTATNILLQVAKFRRAPEWSRLLKAVWF